MAEGDVGAVIANLEFDNSKGGWPAIVHVSGSVYAIAYRGPADDGWIKTVTISAAGALALVAGGTLEFDTVQGLYADIIHVSGSVYAITYGANGNKILTKTVTITDAGAISFADSTGAEQSAILHYEPDVIHIDSSVYAVAYKKSTNQGWLTSFSIETIPEGMIRHELLMGIG